MTPAEYVIKKCGGAAAVAKIVGRTESAVYRWTYSKKDGGTGGTIPSTPQNLLLKAADAGLVSLSPGDFFPVPERTFLPEDDAA